MHWFWFLSFSRTVQPLPCLTLATLLNEIRTGKWFLKKKTIMFLNAFMIQVSKIQILKYGIVGILSTLIHIGGASVFVRFFYESLFISNCVGFLTAFTFSYVAQSRLVFNADLTCKKAVMFFLVQSASLLLAVKTAESMDNFSIYFKIIIVAFLLPVITFFVHKIWTFSDTNWYRWMSGKLSPLLKKILPLVNSTNVVSVRKNFPHPPTSFLGPIIMPVNNT